MDKLKVAILEDNKLLLKELKQNLEETDLVEVVAWSTNSEEFLEKVTAAKPEALLLDIDLGDDNLNGLQVAKKLGLPVIFVTGNTRDFFLNIEELNLNSKITVEHLSKPITTDKLNKLLPKFINELQLLSNSNFVFLDFADSKRNKIDTKTIVYLESDTGKSGESNNKKIYFSNRNSEMLADFSFSKMEEKRFNKNQFITIHKSFRVNADKIISYLTSKHEIEVEVFDTIGKTKIKKLPVSENFQKDVRKYR